MRAHKVRVMVSESHEVSVRLPSDFPRGEAELTIITDARDELSARPAFGEWLDALLAKVPPSPGLPLESLRRENLYE